MTGGIGQPVRTTVVAVVHTRQPNFSTVAKRTQETTDGQASATELKRLPGLNALIRQRVRQIVSQAIEAE
jgi:hypothetical protein